MRQIIFIGDLNKYARTFQRYRALKELNYSVEAISSVPIGRIPGVNEGPNLLERIFGKLGYPLDIIGVNKKLIEIMYKSEPDILWNEKALMLYPETLEKIKYKFHEIT